LHSLKRGKKLKLKKRKKRKKMRKKTIKKGTQTLIMTS